MAALGVAPALPMVRQGECTACGKCCLSLRIQCPPNYAEPDVANWLALHGVTVLVVNGATYASLNRKCSALASDNKTCTLYGKPERPGLCSEFPATPAALHGLEEECGYSWEPA